MKFDKNIFRIPNLEFPTIKTPTPQYDIRDPDEATNNILEFLKEFENKQAEITKRNKRHTIINFVLGLLNIGLLITQILLSVLP